MFKLMSAGVACTESSHVGGVMVCPSAEAAEMGNSKVAAAVDKVREFIAHRQATLDSIARGEDDAEPDSGSGSASAAAPSEGASAGAPTKAPVPRIVSLDE
jgi:hypothetical protein